MQFISPHAKIHLKSIDNVTVHDLIRFIPWESIEFADREKGPVFFAIAVDNPKGPEWLDIYFNDWNEYDRDSPYITITYKDGTSSTIDIIESIRNNAASIGFPFILAAILRWENIVRFYHSVIARGRGSKKDPAGRLWIERQRERYEVAKKHLENVGKALIKGAQERALSRAVFYVAAMDAELMEEHYLLSLVLEELATDKARSKRRHDEKVKLIQKRLEREVLSIHEKSQIAGDVKESQFYKAMNDVMAFLNSPPGKSYLSKIKIVSRRTPKQKKAAYLSLEKEFDTWYLGLEEPSIRKYRSQGLKPDARLEKVDLHTLWPEIRNSYNVLWNWYPRTNVVPVNKDRSKL